MSLFSLPWRNVLILSLLAAALTFGIRFVHGEAAKAVAFVFTDIDNRAIRLADYRGKWVLVSFWAPWCPLCKIQIPNLNKLNQRPDFRVIGIALEYGAEEAAIRDAVSLNNLRFEAHVAGGSRREPNSAFRQVGPVDFFPTSYLYDPTGEIVMFIPGQIRVPRILAFMDGWLAEKGGGQPAFAAKLDKLAAYLRQRHGDKGDKAYAEWKRLLDAGIDLPALDKLARVNDFFNRRIRQGEDQAIWGRADYWATPGELLGSGRGDSEDFVIAKYFTLLALNIPPERLRLVYVKPRAKTRAGADPVHMVLAYYDVPGAAPLILNNRKQERQSSGRRPDLQPVFSFNSLGVWEETASAASAGDPKRLAIWEDTLRRAREQGFE